MAVALAVLFGAGGLGAWRLLPHSDTPPDQPKLFRAADIAPTGRRVAALTPQTHALMHRWWSAHGTRRQDAAFIRWAASHLPAPPTAAARRPELAKLASLARHRTTDGVSAAAWLDDHGRDDIWKAYADQPEPGPANASTEEQLDHLLDWTATTTDALKNQFAVPSPYVVDPALRPDKAGPSGSQDGCTCSYPSSHAAATAAAVTYLGHYYPNQMARYRHMQAEVDYSRLYMAGHVPSDLAAGTVLGDMLAEYYLVTRDNAPAN